MKKKNSREDDSLCCFVEISSSLFWFRKPSALATQVSMSTARGGIYSLADCSDGFVVLSLFLSH